MNWFNLDAFDFGLLVLAVSVFKTYWLFSFVSVLAYGLKNMPCLLIHLVSLFTAGR